MRVRNLWIPLPQFGPQKWILEESRRYIPEGIPLLDGIQFIPSLLLLCHQKQGETEQKDEDRHNLAETSEFFHKTLPFSASSRKKASKFPMKLASYSSFVKRNSSN